VTFKIVKNIYTVTHYTIGAPLDIVIRHFILSNRERVDIFEIMQKHRLKFFSYTYRITDKYGKNRPLVRWDNFNGQIHFETFDSQNRIFNQQVCDYKNVRDILELIRIFKHNLANMDLKDI